MDKLFEHAASIIKESGKSALGFGSLIVLSVATVGVLMFKDARDEHVKLYAFFALLGAFLLCLFTLARSTKKVAQKEERRMANSGAPPFEGSLGGIAGGIVHQPPQAKARRSSGFAGCLIALIVFGGAGMCLLMVMVAALMDLNLDKVIAANGSTANNSSLFNETSTTGASVTGSSEVSGYITSAAVLQLINMTGRVDVYVYSMSGEGMAPVTFTPDEVIATRDGTDDNGNPARIVTLDVDKFKIRLGSSG